MALSNVVTGSLLKVQKMLAEETAQTGADLRKHIDANIEKCRTRQVRPRYYNVF